MNTEIRSKERRLSAALREKATRRLAFALDHMAESIRGVQVRLSDEASPGGASNRCDITVRLQRGGDIHLSETAQGPLQAIGKAADRVAQRVSRHLGRRRRRTSESVRSVA